MRLVCCRSHPWDRPNESVVCETVGTFLFHAVAAHGPLWLKSWLVDTGFLDTAPHEPYEFAPLFWRWDYWNAYLAAKYRADEQRRWEARRAAARARWGETAG